MPTLPKVSSLRPGDNLLFARRGFFNKIIALKTWCKSATHSEVYLGYGRVAASRNGQGVATYNLDLSGLSYVRRPKKKLNINQATEWHRHCIGQKYDWLGLLAFWFAAWQASPNKQWCSEHSTRFYRAGGFEPFNPDWDADRVAPATLLSSSEFETIWRDDEKFKTKTR